MYSNHICFRLIPSPRQHLTYNSVNSFGSLWSARLKVSSMESLVHPSLYPGLEQYRFAPQGAAPGNVVVVVPPNNASAESEERKFPRKNEARGAIQIIIGMVHGALGGILLFSSKEFAPLTMTVWYPFWGAALFFLSGHLASAAAVKPIEGLAAASHIFNSFSGLGALAGICLLTIDLIKIFILDHQQTSPQFLTVIAFLSRYIVPLLCEGNLNSADYCRVIKAYQTGILSVMLIFSTMQAVAAFSTLHSCQRSDVAILPKRLPTPGLEGHFELYKGCFIRVEQGKESKS